QGEDDAKGAECSGRAGGKAPKNARAGRVSDFAGYSQQNAGDQHRDQEVCQADADKRPQGAALHADLALAQHGPVNTPREHGQGDEQQESSKTLHGRDAPSQTDEFTRQALSRTRAVVASGLAHTNPTRQRGFFALLLSYPSLARRVSG